MESLSGEQQLREEHAPLVGRMDRWMDAWMEGWKDCMSKWLSIVKTCGITQSLLQYWPCDCGLGLNLSKWKYYYFYRAVVVGSLSHVQLFVTPDCMQHARLPGPPPSPRACSNSHPLSQWCHPTISSCCPLLLPSIFPSIRFFSNESAPLCIRWPKYWSFSISPSNENSGLICFRTDWFDLFAVQGTLRSLLQHHSSKTSILQFTAFFMVQLSHLYMTTGKSIALTMWTFVSKVITL